MTKPRHIVGIGASAGGLQPLIDLLRAGPADSGLAFVVVQHLAPQQPSALPDLLACHVPWRVDVAADGMDLRADHVYVIRPGTRLAVEGGRLRVTPAAVSDGGLPAVDHLLHSLAQDAGRSAVGVVLSGMGHDGSQGLKAIARAGGVAVAQSPASAQFDDMPRHAATAAGPGVIVAEPGAIVQRIVDALAARGAHPAPAAPAAGRLPREVLDGVLDRLAEVTGSDFSQYKPSTLVRRLERRMAIHGSTSSEAYLQLLQTNAQEVQLLFRELLIGVTTWFRDPPLWETLKREVLPGLCAGAAARPDRRLRAWVAGCSTGEEAYSLAMVCREVIDADPALQHLAVQIFASDLDADAIDFARRGLFTEAAVKALPHDRLDRFFLREGAGWRAHPALREMLLFARHDVISDPPFSRQDLVSCRNLLIYFQPALQQRVLELLRYVLQPGGVLMLGSSEALGRAEALYKPLDNKLRLYRGSDVPLLRRTIAFPIQPAAPAADHAKETHVPEDPRSDAASMQTLVERLMLEEFAPPAVLVDANGDILYLSGHTGPYLEPASGKSNWNVHAMARGGLRTAIAKAMADAAGAGRAADVRGFVELGPQGVPHPVSIAARPVRGLRPGTLAELYLLVFSELPPPADAAKPRRGRQRPLEAELHAAREEAQALREEMRSSQEELQATNEELQSTNEELQSANEELTTSKEEMQAMNEELQTVNAELVSRLDDLALAQSDLQNLLNSTQIATLFLDGQGNVRRFTEQTKKLFSLRDSDVGRPLSDLTTSLDYGALEEDIREVLRTLEYRERAVPTSDGRWYTVRVMPYRTQQQVIDGSVLTFVDITAARQLEAKAGTLPAGGA